MSDSLAPIIVRRKKVYKQDAGHHGGAWKVAYADFVTAMMAFFLLMWLLNATTEEQRKGLADYFSPAIPVAAVSGGGAGALDGASIYTQETMINDGTGAKDTSGTNEFTEAQETAALEERVAALNEAIARDNSDLANHIKFKTSPEGLVIELIDQSDRPLFSSGSARPSETLTKLAEIVASGFSEIGNKIKIVGHTDGHTYVSGREYSNWELSSDRANTARRLLTEYGFPIYQISEVSGKSSTEPLSPNPLDPQNRRISITLLTPEL
jgi:chemotaxis protein MotB